MLWDSVGQFPLIEFPVEVKGQTAGPVGTDVSRGWFIAGELKEGNYWPLVTKHVAAVGAVLSSRAMGCLHDSTVVVAHFM